MSYAGIYQPSTSLSMTLKTCVAYNSMDIDVAGVLPRVKRDRNFAGKLSDHENDQLIDAS